MIWVFKTSVRTRTEARNISEILRSIVLSGGSWSFDLDDCDKVLRIESEKLEITSLQLALAQEGVVCEELDD